MRHILLAAMFTLLFSQTSNAGIFIEPGLGYNFQSYENNATGGDKGTANGLGLSAKLGYTFTPIIFAGLDVNYSMVTKDSDTAGTANIDGTQTAIGLVAGVDIMMLRAWLGYYFSDTFAFDAQDYSGSAFKLGVGYSIMPMINLNIEYIMHTYDEFESNSNGVTGSIDLDASSVFVSVSVPLSI